MFPRMKIPGEKGFLKVLLEISRLNLRTEILNCSSLPQYWKCPLLYYNTFINSFNLIISFACIKVEYGSYSKLFLPC